jgi:hypothetical protein
VIEFYGGNLSTVYGFYLSHLYLYTLIQHNELHGNYVAQLLICVQLRRGIQASGYKSLDDQKLDK